MGQEACLRAGVGVANPLKPCACCPLVWGAGTLVAREGAGRTPPAEHLAHSPPLYHHQLNFAYILDIAVVGNFFLGM